MTPREGDEVPIERLQALPKPELHVHLDGSLRPSTMLALARDRNVTMPESSEGALADHMLVSDAASLEDYLERFETTLSVMQDAEAIERIAYELALDHAAENVRYVEVRFCPLLNTAGTLSSDEVLDAALAGLDRAEGDAGIRTNLIVCALRSHDPKWSMEMADLAVAYRDRGVCGFDLAGGESGHPVRDHQEAFDRVARAELPITVHAGEGYGPESIRQAIELGHAKRIGHGTRLFEDTSLLETVRARRIPLEVCLTSNVQTRVVSSYETHPAGRYLLDGLTISLGTDNRLMSGVSLSDEYAHARAAFDLSWTELVSIARAGFEHAFVRPGERARLLSAFDEEVAELT